MIPSSLPVGAAPLCAWLALALDFSTRISAGALAATDATWLVELDVYADRGVLTVVSGPVQLAGLGWHPLSALPFGTSTPTLRSLGWSDTGWIGEPGDAGKPNEIYPGRVINPLRYSRSISILPESQVRAATQYGSVDLANGDGGLSDTVDRSAITGRRVRVLRGERKRPLQARYSEFTPVLDGIATGWQEVDQSVRVTVRDALAGLDLPMQTSLYAGTGGAEGPADYVRRPKPATFGYAQNITPDLVDAAYRVYRCNDGRMAEVVAVRDRGASLVRGIDYTTYAALVAASIPSGQFATCLAQGLFRLNNTNPNAFITADVRGDAAGSYVDTHAAIARRILGRSSLRPAQIDAGSFDGLPLGSAGFFFPSSAAPTVAEALDMVIGSCAGWWGTRRDGRVMAGTMARPEDRNPVLDLDPLMRADPSELARPTPRGRQTVGYARLWTVQDRGSLVDTVSDANKQFYGQEYRLVGATRDDTLIRYPYAADPAPLASGYRLAGDAQALAATLLGLHGIDRRVWSVPLGPEAYQLDIGQVVTWTPPRAPARNWLVVGFDENADDVILTLWG